MSSSTFPTANRLDDDAAMSRLASVGQISAGIAHEVKNPLTAVRGFLQLMQEKSPHAYVDFAYTELQRAIETLENLLNVSKPDLDNEQYVDISLCAELESILYLFQEQSYNVKIHTSYHDSNELITGKRNQIKRAFFNVIKNAFEAMDGNGDLYIHHYCFDNTVRVTIGDTGVGIPQSELDILGTPFFSTKTNGTGMGLTQVFSTIYQHGGKVEVASELSKGTTFCIDFPLKHKQQLGVTTMNVTYVPGQVFSDFYAANETDFMELLKANGQEFFQQVRESSSIEEEYLLSSVKSITKLLTDENEHGLVMEARIHGKAWARHNLSLILKLEWFQVVRKLYSDLLYHFFEESQLDVRVFFEMVARVNFNFDSYLKHFSASYSELKTDQIEAQTALIDDLTVPVIPLSSRTAILPIVGMLDTHRAKKVQENVLHRISELRLQQLVIDLSGVAFMDTAVAGHMFRIVDGIGLLGCKAILTGLRPEIVNTIIQLGISLTDKVQTFGTLQQAIEEYGLAR